LTVKFRTSNK